MKKVAPPHWCEGLFVIVAYIVEEDGDIIMDLEQMEEQETPGIYLTAYH